MSNEELPTFKLKNAEAFTFIKDGYVFYGNKVPLADWMTFNKQLQAIPANKKKKAIVDPPSVTEQKDGLYKEILAYKSTLKFQKYPFQIYDRFFTHWSADDGKVILRNQPKVKNFWKVANRLPRFWQDLKPEIQSRLWQQDKERGDNNSNTLFK